MGIGTSKPVQLRQLFTSKTDTGRNITAEASSFNAFAEISNPSGSRQYEYGQTLLEQTKIFLIRFRFDKYPSSQWKILYDSRDWTVTNIERVEERHFFWRITATSKGDV
jgi:SPP1 family predicted phage head-tail adaptor